MDTMITGAHSILYSTMPEADRAFLRDVLELSSVDVGEGWLVFALPPAELAVHPSDQNDVHTLYLMCDDIEDFTARLAEREVECSPVQDHGWGLLTQLTLPGGGKLSVYEPRHPRPEPAQTTEPPEPRKTSSSAAKKKGGAKKPAKKKPPKKTPSKTSSSAAKKKGGAKKPAKKKPAKKRTA